MNYLAVFAEFSHMLKNLSAILDKGTAYANEKKFDEQVLLNARLAPDQFNLIRQVQIACDTAKGAAASLANKEIPAHPDTEVSVAELKARIDTVCSYLHSFKASDFDGASSRPITRPRWEGKHLLGEEFLHVHVIPNFYFHVTTAYAILRHNGVTIGKRDFLGTINYRA